MGQIKYLTLSVDDLKVIKWNVDTSFAVHPDFKSHNRENITMVQGVIQSVSMKQILNTGNITYA